MAEKFDEFSKHLAKRQTRRGLLKFYGAGIIGAFAATALPRRSAEADPDILHIFKKFLIFNGTNPNINGTNPNFNSTLPFLLAPPPAFNRTQPLIFFNRVLPRFWNHHR